MQCRSSGHEKGESVLGPLMTDLAGEIFFGPLDSHLLPRPPVTAFCWAGLQVQHFESSAQDVFGFRGALFELEV